ncbi:MAG: nucleotide exchange factor GrpE [Candidatus Acidiferrales bacterium]
MSRREDSEKQEKDEQKGENVKADARADAPESETAGGATEETAVMQEIEKLAAEKSDLKNTLVRLQADFDNYRKRTERERHQERHRGAEAIVEHLLPVLDAFDRAISSHRDAAHDEHRKGFELIRKQLFDVLAKQGVQRIETQGKRFDPHVHHAIERIETNDQPDGAVLEELQAGYEFHGKVLRPAMVRVAVNPQSQDSESKTTVN